MTSLYSQKLERHVLSGAIKNPETFAEIDSLISEKDFYFKIHEVIFKLVREKLIKGETVDQVILSQKIQNLGVSFNDISDIPAYVESVCFIKPSKKAAVEAASELKKLSVKRELCTTLEKAKSTVSKSGNKDLDKIVAEADALYNSTALKFDLNDAPKNIFANLKEQIIDRANNPVDDTGLKTPFPEFNRMYGGLRSGNLYAIASRPGQGKSSFLMSLGVNVSRINNCHVLYLDTEMSNAEQQFRLAASLSGVPLWYLETGKWKTNDEYREKVEESFSKFNDSKFYHFEAGNKDVDEIISVIRRWHLQRIKKDEKCMIIYDYVKMTGERVGQNWAEHQAIGDKIDKLKKISEEINAPLFTAIQLNRSGENQNRRGSDIVDDSSAISLSDRLQWFASFVAIFRRKTLDEIASDGEQFGTHKLVPTKTRFQGQDAAGHQDLVRRRVEEIVRGEPTTVERWCLNFLNFNIDNFNVVEQGSLRDIVEFEDGRVNISQPLNDMEETLGD